MLRRDRGNDERGCAGVQSEKRVPLSDRQSVPGAVSSMRGDGKRETFHLRTLHRNSRTLRKMRIFFCRRVFASVSRQSQDSIRDAENVSEIHLKTFPESHESADNIDPNVADPFDTTVPVSEGV